MIIFLRPVLYLAGLMQLILAGLMLIPCLLELLSGGPDAGAFFDCAFLTCAVALSLILSMKTKIPSLSVRQMYLLVTVTWLITCAVCSLPYVTCSIQLSPIDAYFETMSGLTTTGSTVIVGLDNLPPGILLWRSMTQWIGGIGIVGIALVFFPFMRIGGMQLFKSESSEKGDKVVAQARTFAASLISVYLIISVLSAVTFHLAGMNWFDAINHMMTAVSSGGFSTKDASLGHYHSLPILWAAIFGMIMSALPFTWFMKFSVDFHKALQDKQVQTFLSIFLATSIAMTVWVLENSTYTAFEALSHSAHNVISIMTTTGFVSTDYSQWGSFAIILFVLLYFSGGCTGSTTGSVKFFRWQIFFSSIRHQLLRMMLPHRVVSVKFNGKTVNDDVREAVANFIILFFLTWLVTSALLGLTGLDLVTALTASLTSVANVGPGFGDIVGPVGSFAPLSDPAKWICAGAMLLGRLEIFAVIMVFIPSFWRD